MLFSSYTFLFQFLPATALAFAAARLHSPRAGIMVLAAASLVFYGAWRPIYLLLLLASIAVNFSLGLRMEDPLRRRAIGAFGVVLNLALLCYFKYTNFIFDSVNTLTGAPLPFFNIVLPLGISFFTFQQIAYLVDVMRGVKVERDIVSYTLFVSFFPHLIAGPLVHHAEMIPQFKRGRTARSAVLAARGLAIFAAGLFKKVVIADNLAQFVSPVFAHLDAGGGVTTPWAWLATLAYSLQIYFDFSGYSDMAIGLALSFAIRLPVNFRSPYQATSIIEFWRRWHITLSRFLRDYLYIPLGGNRHGRLRRYANLMTVMLLGGLWHGANWNFVFWGGLHGAYLTVNHLWRDGGRRPLPWRLGWAITLIAVMFAWVPFRSPDLSATLSIWSGMIGLNGIVLPQWAPFAKELRELFPNYVEVRSLLHQFVVIQGPYPLLAIPAGLGIAVLLPNLYQWLDRFQPAMYYEPRPVTARWTFTWRPTLPAALALAAATATALIFAGRPLTYLYWQF